ncbi:hypothetical protein BKA63DRAFT_474270 [Paraphoma chrysanthemicola]|nr:hypothetical protein BKA63DRAFT_474270 [Paraphoma chrysanthemicola]
MEAVAALGFAANIVQFVDFSTRVISQTVRVYRTRSQSSIGHDETDLDEIGLRIERYVAPLLFDVAIKEYLDGRLWVSQSARMKAAKANSAWKRTAQPILNLHHVSSKSPELDELATAAHHLLATTDAITRLSASDKEIIRTCIKCEDVASSLQLALNKLRSENKTKTTPWSCFKEALRTVWSDDKLLVIKQELEHYRQQMTSLLLVSVREKVEASRLAQNAMHKDLYSSTKDIRRTMNLLFSAQEQWKSEIIQALKSSHQRHSLFGDTSPSTVAHMQSDMSPQSRREFDERLRGWVQFTDMDTRYQKIAKAHEQTFEWIFRPPRDENWSNFPAWLETDRESLYWITAKPAAGKSTLLKFIYNDDRTSMHLKHWAGDKKLINCAFYFWNSGGPMQMSEEGMRRTLLHSALLQAPELWEVLFPSKMEEFILFSDPWLKPITSTEINCAFQQLLEGAGSQYRLFMFIDGLDEFGGDHSHLVAFVQGLLSPDVKVCVSSRPWPVFEDAFQHQPRLRLENLTYNDIKYYVTSRFSSSQGYYERQLETPDEVENLIESITHKASGVFLWVQLVTDSLLKGLAAGERLEELQCRLNAVPVDLEELFWKILTQVEDGYRRNMSQLFQIMRASAEPLTVLDMSYADDPDTDIVLKTQFGRLESEKAKGRALRMRRRLNTCCKGLLEADSNNNETVASTRVTYLHRTVRDYIERPEVWSRFVEITGDDFQLYFRMYNMHAIQIKAINTCDQDLWKAMLYAIEAATRVATSNEAGRQVKLLTQLDEIGTQCARGKLSATFKHWSSRRKTCRLNTSFLHLAIQLQLHEYVQYALLSKAPMQSDIATKDKDEATMLLMATLHYDIFTKDSELPKLSFIPTSPSVDLIKLFLERGADPNHIIEGALLTHGNITGSYSPWGVHLREPNRSSQSWSEISRLLLDHGADPDQVRSTTPDMPEDIVALAQQKSIERQDLIRRTRKKDVLGSIFKVGKWRGLAGPGVARTR